MQDQDSIGTDKDLQPFWNKFTEEVQKELWLPTKTDYVDLELSQLNGSSEKLVRNSWFLVKIQENKNCQKNLPKTFLPLQQSLQQRIMDLDQQKIKEKENLKNS